jgi:thiosulfate/3-mercaptopyruvate sulfurtransferase
LGWELGHGRKITQTKIIDHHQYMDKLLEEYIQNRESVRPANSQGSTDYVNPEVLVSTEWIATHLNEPDIRIVYCDGIGEDFSNPNSLIPGSVRINWRSDLQDADTGDYISPKAFAALCSSRGITPDTTVIFYSGELNCWATYAIWAFKLYGHEKVKLLNGGHDKWLKENRPTVSTVTKPALTNYSIPSSRRDKEIRAVFTDTLQHMVSKNPIIDVRSSEEYRGETTLNRYPEVSVLRGGHIPGAVNIPWNKSLNDDGTFKSANEIRKIYSEESGLQTDNEIIVYCNVGERSSHTWFTLTYLLGYTKVRNYDASWSEWAAMHAL